MGCYEDARGGYDKGDRLLCHRRHEGGRGRQRSAYKTNQKVSADFAEYGPVMMEAMQAKKVPTWMDNLVSAKEIGNVKISACSMTMELFGLQLSDMESIVDEVTGVAVFTERARESKITLFM